MITAGDVNLLLACLAVGVTVLWRRAEHRARTAEWKLSHVLSRGATQSIQGEGHRVHLHLIAGGRLQ